MASNGVASAKLGEKFVKSGQCATKTLRPVLPPTCTTSTSTCHLHSSPGRECEDTITLLTQWQNHSDGSLGTAVYTASWVTPRADAHTQQHFHYMGQSGELRVDQAHRGYTSTTDSSGFASLNPLHMR